MTERQANRVARGHREKYRTWCGTVWLLDDLNTIKSMDYEYLLIGHEEETQEEQKHWHVLIRFKYQRVRPRTINAHWEMCASALKFREYATKEGAAEFESGVLNINKNNKDDWAEFVEMCKHLNPVQLIDSPFSRTYARFRSFAGEVHNQFIKRDILEGDLHNEWWWGKPGTGKSMKAFSEHPDAYIKSLNKWWDGYHDQDVVIIDDWGPNQEVLVDHLKHWADRYPFPAEVKGSAMKIRPKKIIITSNYTIEQCFQRIEDQEAIRRRFKVTQFHKGLVAT